MSYLWRKLTPPKRAEILSYRQFLKRSWHRPPHYDQGNTHYHLDDAADAATNAKLAHESIANDIALSIAEVRSWVSPAGDLLLSSGSRSSEVVNPAGTGT
jgi:hypothetical protein